MGCARLSKVKVCKVWLLEGSSQKPSLSPSLSLSLQNGCGGKSPILLTFKILIRNNNFKCMNKRLLLQKRWHDKIPKKDVFPQWFRLWKDKGCHCRAFLERSNHLICYFPVSVYDLGERAQSLITNVKNYYFFTLCC